MAKLKRGLKYSGYVYFEPVGPNVMYQAVNFLITYYKFFENIFISEDFSNKKMKIFSDIDELQ